jgi:hypothetical protein
MDRSDRCTTVWSTRSTPIGSVDHGQVRGAVTSNCSIGIGPDNNSWARLQQSLRDDSFWIWSHQQGLVSARPRRDGRQPMRRAMGEDG